MASRCSAGYKGVMRYGWTLAAIVVLAGSLSAKDPRTSIDDAVAEIDQLMRAAWKRDKVNPTKRSDDAEFSRRVWFDLAGVAPPISEVRAFLRQSDPDKRDRLIDRLLVSPQHATHMAATWKGILLPPDAQNLRQRQNIAALQRWLRNQFVENTPYDYFVASFLTAGGESNRGPAVFYTTRDVEPKKIAAATSKIFLGIQLQCAECHDHPFDRWTQEDFWSYTAFFGQISQSNDRMQPGNGFIIDRPSGEVTMPDSDDAVSPRYPGVEEPPEEDITNNRRRQLTIWMASRDNPYFVRAAVNRAWAHMFGRGLVDPVDAMDKDNPPSHPQVMDYLANYLIEHRFDMRVLLSTLARTEAYQLSSAVDGDRPNEATFAAMTVKTLTPRQYYESVRQNIMRRSAMDANGADFRRDQFINRMKTTETNPREYPHGVMQALGIMNGPEMASSTVIDGGLIDALSAPFFDRKARIETLYLAALSRFPTTRELDLVNAYFDHAKGVKTSAENEKTSEDAKLQSEVLWSLLNTAEATVCP